MTSHLPIKELFAPVNADPARRERVQSIKRAIDDSLALAELRQSQGKTQREVAETLGVSQANVSRIEHEEDVYLSTLRSYAEALGGRLEVNVVFPEMTYTFVASEDHE
jgi:DNA-binding XRE family transcriptional regulator